MRRITGRRVTLVSVLAILIHIDLPGCRTPELINDYDNVDKETAERLIGGDADFAAFCISATAGVFRITKPEVVDEHGYRDLDEQAFECEVDRISKLPWNKPPSAIVIYFGGSAGTQNGFPKPLWERVKVLLKKRGYQPIALIYESPTFGPTIGVPPPFNRPEPIEKRPQG